jgi:hypothetical protein
VRRDSTNLEIRFHTDNAYNGAPPDYVGLLCVRPAKCGGVSQVTSFYTAHNALLAHHRTTLRRLYQPFLFDRQREHASGDSLVAANPIFRYRDGLRVQLAVSLIRAGYRLADQEIDEEGDQELWALDSVLDDVSCWQEFEFRPGKCSFSTIGPAATSGPPSRTIPTRTPCACSSDCGYGTGATAPIPADGDRKSSGSASSKCLPRVINSAAQYSARASPGARQPFHDKAHTKE